jgi:hypothetical protein
MQRGLGARYSDHVMVIRSRPGRGVASARVSKPVLALAQCAVPSGVGFRLLKFANSRGSHSARLATCVARSGTDPR